MGGKENAAGAAMPPASSSEGNANVQLEQTMKGRRDVINSAVQEAVNARNRAMGLAPGSRPPSGGTTPAMDGRAAEIEAVMGTAPHMGGGPGAAGVAAAAAWEMADKNNDGVIDRAEFEAFQAAFARGGPGGMGASPMPAGPAMSLGALASPSPAAGGGGSDGSYRMPSHSLRPPPGPPSAGPALQPLGAQTIQVMQAEILTLQKQLARAEHRSSLLQGNGEESERYRSSAEEAQRRLVVGAAAVEQAMAEAHTMRARATQAENSLEEARLQLEIARQEVTDEQQLGKRRVKELQREMEAFSKQERLRAKSYALKRVGAAILSSGMRDARGWLEIVKENWRHDQGLTKGTPLGPLGLKMQGLSLMQQVLELWAGQRVSSMVARWKQGSVVVKKKIETQCCSLSLLNMVMLRWIKAATQSCLRTWSIGVFVASTVLRERARTVLHRAMAKFKVGGMYRSLAFWRLQATTQGYKTLVQDVSHEAACVLLWKYIGKRNSNASSRAMCEWKIKTVTGGGDVSAEGSQRPASKAPAAGGIKSSKPASVSALPPLAGSVSGGVDRGENDSQDLLFKAMRLECASRVIAEWTKRQEQLAMARCLGNYKQHVGSRKERMTAEVSARKELGTKLKEQERRLSGTSRGEETGQAKSTAQKTAIQFLDKFIVHDTKLSTSRHLRTWLGNISEHARNVGAYEEAERSALLFRKCKVALKDGDKLRRQLKVVRGVYLMVVIHLLEQARFQVSAAKGVVTWAARAVSGGYKD